MQEQQSEISKVVQQDSEFSRRCLGFYLCSLIVGLVASIPLLLGDLWYDELITYWNYLVKPPTPFAIFQDYHEANNHIYFSFLLNLCYRALGTFGENSSLNLPLETLRLLPLSFGIAGSLWIYWFWRPFLGRWGACIGAVAFVVSPIMLSFYWQLRGYSLSILLSIICLTAMMELRRTVSVRWLAIYAVSAGLLPGVVPSNLLVTVCIFGLFVLEIIQAGEFRKRLGLIAGMGLFTVWGGLLYVPLVDQFRQVIRQNAGWNHGVLVFASVLLGLVLHLAPLLAIVFVKKDAIKRVPQGNLKMGVYLLVAPLLLLLLLCLVRSPAPYPRVFLGFFPICTLGLMLILREFSVLNPEVSGRRLIPKMVMVALIMQTIFWCSDGYSKIRLKHGRYSQSLVAQYYRGDKEVSRLVSELNRLLVEQAIELPDELLVEPQHAPRMSYYWSRSWPKKRVKCTNCGQGIHASKDSQTVWLMAINRQVAEELAQRTVGDRLREGKFILDRKLYVIYQASLRKAD